MTHRNFAGTAAIYTLAYAIAVIGDHATTLLAIGAGAVETNVLFQSAGSGLAGERATLVFVLLWPLLLWQLWIADRQRRGALQERGWIARQFLGRTAATAALLPFTVVVAKCIAATSNLMIVWFGFPLTRPIRLLIESAGIYSERVNFIAGGLAILIVALWIAYEFASAWSGRFRSPDGVEPAQ